MDLSDSVLLIRGPKGTTVRLTILREGEPDPVVVSVVRDSIDIPSVDGVTLLTDHGAPDIGYLQLTVFASETRDELIDALEELRSGGAKALILDLRNNPGGFLNTALDVTSEFIDSGVVVLQEDNRGRRTAMEARTGGHATDVPLVVLVNRGSASASEIVAGAIRDRKRGVLVGAKTFGKGSVQNVHELSDGSQLRVTVAVWLTPNGTLIHREGIVPDVVVSADGEEPRAVASGTAAAATPTTGPSASPSARPLGEAQESGDKAVAEDVDRQLERAIVEARTLMEAPR
jgi:carboxyl-terminal processing protease